MPAPGLDAGQALLEGRAGMAERHDVAVADEVANQIQVSVDLRRDRQDADVLRAALAITARMSAPEKWAASGCRPGQHLGGRPAQAAQRLRAAKVRRDEVALEVRRQHVRAAGDRRRARGADAVEQVAQLGRARTPRSSDRTR